MGLHTCRQYIPARAHRLSALHPEDKRVLTSSNAVAMAWRAVAAPSTRTATSSTSRFPSSSSKLPSSASFSRGGVGASPRGMCAGCSLRPDNRIGGGGGGDSSLAEEGWTAFLCAVREEEERGEREQREAAAAAEREVYAAAAHKVYQRSGGLLGGGGGGGGGGVYHQHTGRGGEGRGVGSIGGEFHAPIPMYPIGPPLTSTHVMPGGAGASSTKVRRMSYLIG